MMKSANSWLKVCEKCLEYEHIQPEMLVSKMSKHFKWPGLIFCYEHLKNQLVNMEVFNFNREDEKEFIGKAFNCKDDNEASLKASLDWLKIHYQIVGIGDSEYEKLYERFNPENMESYEYIFYCDACENLFNRQEYTEHHKICISNDEHCTFHRKFKKN